jgi:hypothetical protein
MTETENTLQKLEWGEETIINDHIEIGVGELLEKNPGQRLPSHEELVDGLNEDPNGFSLGIYVVSEGHDLIKYYDLASRQFVISPVGTVRCRLVKE